jgi:hypothetical protein
MIHRLNIEKYDGTLQELTVDIGNLRYDALADFFRLLSEKIETDAVKDRSSERYKLAVSLCACAEKLREASADIDRSWKICEPYTK